jgi:hypothetical protein
VKSELNEVVEDVTCRFSGVKVQVTPTGSAVSVYEPALTGGPAHERLTNPVKLLPGVIVATILAASPGADTVADVGLIESAKVSPLVAEETAMTSDSEAA